MVADKTREQALEQTRPGPKLRGIHNGNRVWDRLFGRGGTGGGASS